MLRTLPHDALLTKIKDEEGKVDTPLARIGANPLLDWRLLEKEVMFAIRSYIVPDEGNTPGHSQVKEHSLYVGEAIYDAVMVCAADRRSTVLGAKPLDFATTSSGPQRKTVTFYDQNSGLLRRRSISPASGCSAGGRTLTRCVSHWRGRTSFWLRSW
jgi:hypothetical protein